MTTWRSICGHVQEQVREPNRPGTLAACFAHLTSYGRLLMARTREQLPHRSVIWQDTDGIAIRASAVPSLVATGMVDQTRYGSLRCEGQTECARYLTPKHYWIDGRWVLAGVASGFMVDDNMVSATIETRNPVRSAEQPKDNGIHSIIKYVHLDRIDPGVRIGDDGWMIPPRIDADRHMGVSERNVPTLFG